MIAKRRTLLRCRRLKRGGAAIELPAYCEVESDIRDRMTLGDANTGRIGRNRVNSSSGEKAGPGPMPEPRLSTRQPAKARVLVVVPVREHFPRGVVAVLL